MTGGLMYCGLKSGGLMSGGLKSYDRANHPSVMQADTWGYWQRKMIEWQEALERRVSN